MYKSKAFAATSPTSPLAYMQIPRREPTPNDVQIEILYCGICHSDIHTARNEWRAAGDTVYPCVPGHEIVGRVTKVGADVKGFKVGDLAGVGVLVDADLSCPHCKANNEQFSPTSAFTYGSPDRYETAPVTYGGYSDSIVVNEHFVLRIPANLDLAATAPLLCAGITTYSPLKHWGVTKGKKVGIVGLGGLGHMGVKFANAFGAEVTVFTTSPKKTEDAKRLGAHHVVVSSDGAAMQKEAGAYDFILDTVSAQHDLNAYLGMLKPDGTLTLVGLPEHQLPIAAFSLILGRRSLSGSCIGGIAETQEMLDFCSTHNIASDVEVIPVQKINEAYERIIKSDVKYRFCIDMASIKSE